MKLFLILGALLSALTVILGAFGAHGLKNKLTSDMMAVYETATQYQMYHSLGLLLIGLIGLHFISNSLDLGWIKISGFCLLVGILFFSGSLYLYVFTGTKWLGMITPLGGLAFIIGWISLAIALTKIN